MSVRSQARTLALPLTAQPTVRIDYFKLVVWIAGVVVPWAGIAALYLGR